MISRGNGNFVVRHYDWLVAGLGFLALLGGAAYYVLSLGADADGAASEAVRMLELKKPAKSGVEVPDMTAFGNTLRQTKTPAQALEVDSLRESFLASERRVKCACGAVMVSGLTNCPSCKTSLIVVNKEDEAAKVVNRWKARYGVEADQGDKDGDGFTNAEEFEAKTDPTDAKDHPDYIDSLKLELPLKETYVPFALLEYVKLPSGWRCVFNNAKRSSRMTATIGEEILLPVSRAVGKAESKPTGYVLKDFKKKEEAQGFIAGTKTPKMVDVSVAVVERKSDGKIVSLVLQDPKRIKLTPVDIQANLVYTRMGTKNFSVVTGDEIALNGEKFKVLGVKAVGKGGEVTLESVVTGRKKTLQALE